MISTPENSATSPLKPQQKTAFRGGFLTVSTISAKAEKRVNSPNSSSTAMISEPA